MTSQIEWMPSGSRKEKKGEKKQLDFFFSLLFTGYNYILKGSTQQFYIIGAGLAAVCVT